MALADFQPARHEIKLKGGSFHVEGLSLEAISRLIQQHLDDLEALFTLFEKSNQLSADADMRGIATALVQTAPGLVANIIALGAGEPDMAPKAAKLPAPVQIDVLMTIGDLTFSETGGIKKSLETIAALLGQVRAAKPQLTEMVAKAG